MVDVEKLRTLLAAATPGPWAPEVWEETNDGGWAAVGPHHHGAEDEDDDAPDCAAWDRAWCDANLIAAVVNALPELLDEVERLRAENARLRARKAELCPCVRRYETPGCDECDGVGAVMVEGPE